MLDLPSGTVTFLFTDIEGSTRLLHELRDRYGDVLEAHARLLRAAFEEHDGREIDTQGDSFFIAFKTAKDALAAAVAAQRNLAAEPWPDGIRPAVRMGMHTGEPSVAGEHYLGLAVHRASRICSAAHGGQILLSGTTADLVADELPAGMSLRTLGEHNLKDFERAERIFQVGAEGLPAEFPPLASGRPSEDLDAFRGRERELAEAAEAAVVDVAEIARPGCCDGVALLAVDDKRLWISANDSVTVQRFDTESGRLGPTICCDVGADALAVGGDALWAVERYDQQIVRLDPDTGAIQAKVPFGAPLPPGRNFLGTEVLSAAVASEAGAWIVDSVKGQVWQIDPVQDTVVRTISVGAGAKAIALGFGSVWVAIPVTQTVLRIDPSSGRVIGRIKVAARLAGIATAGGAVWVAVR